MNYKVVVIGLIVLSCSSNRGGVIDLSNDVYTSPNYSLICSILEFKNDDIDGYVTISGIVKDSITLVPLVSASIIIQGTKIGSATDQNGEFILSEIKIGDTISINTLGYFTKRVKIDNSVLLKVY